MLYFCLTSFALRRSQVRRFDTTKVQYQLLNDHTMFERPDADSIFTRPIEMMFGDVLNNAPCLPLTKLSLVMSINIYHLLFAIVDGNRITQPLICVIV